MYDILIYLFYLLYSQWGDVYRLIPLAKARPDTGAISVCIRHPTDCISV